MKQLITYSAQRAACKSKNQPLYKLCLLMAMFLVPFGAWAERTETTTTYTFSGIEPSETEGIYLLQTTEGQSWKIDYPDCWWSDGGDGVPMGVSFSMSEPGESINLEPNGISMQGVVRKFEITFSHASNIKATLKVGETVVGSDQCNHTFDITSTTLTITSSGEINLSGQTPTIIFSVNNTNLEYETLAEAYLTSIKVTTVPALIDLSKEFYSITAIADQTYTGEEIRPTVEVAFASAGQGVGPSIVPSTAYNVAYANNTNVGQATVTVTGIENEGYTGTKTATFNITKAAATVTAPTAKSGLTYTGSAQALINAGSATGGTIQYSTDGTTYGTAIPTGTEAKTYTVYYKVVGDANHNDVAAQSITVTIGKAVASVTAPTAKSGLTYTGSAQALVNAGSATGGTIQYSTDGTTYGTAIPMGTEAKTYTVYYKVVGDANHNDVAAQSITVTIGKANASVTAPTAKSGLTYTGSAQALINAGSATGGTIQYSTDGTTYGTAIPTGTEAKTYTVYYKVVGDANHNDVAAQSINVTIGKAAASVTAPTAKSGLTYTGSAQALVNAGSATGGTIQYSTDGTTYGTAIPTGTEAKTYTVYYKVVGDANHNDVAAQSITVTIGKANASVTAPTAKSGLTYTGSAQALINAGSATGGTIQYSTDGTTYGTTIPTGTEAKTYTVYYKVVGDANHNDLAAQSITVTIGKANASVTAPTAKSGLTYTGSAQVLINAGSATGGTIQYSTDGTTYGTAIPTGTEAKTYTVYYKVVGDANHNDVAAQSITVTIGKSAASVTAPTAKSGLTYTGSAQALVNAGSATGGTIQYSTDGTTYGTAIPTGTEAKTYTVYYKVVGDANHNDLAAQSINVTIGKANASVTAPTAKNGLTYTGSAQALINAGSATVGTIQYSTDGTTYGTKIPTGTEAKTYTVYYKVVGDANHNDVAAQSINVTIGKASGSISYASASVSKTFGDAAFTNALTKTGDGTVAYSSSNTAVATVDSDGLVTIVGSGSTTITATMTDGTNYTYVTKTATYSLTVGGATMNNVSATGYTGVYDGSAHGITVTAPAGATIKYGTSAGTYNLTASPTYTNGGTYTVYYEVTMPNYNPVTGSAIVTITKADAKVTYNPYNFTAKIGEYFSAPYAKTEPAGLPLVYSSSDENVATVNAETGEVTLVAPGKVDIYATFEGNENYNSARGYYILTVLQRDIEPIDEDKTLDLEEKDFFTTNDEGEMVEINLSNTVIYDILFTLDISGDPSENDGYDETEGCVVLNYSISDYRVNYIVSSGFEPGTEQYANEYTGLTFKVPAGKGYVIIDSKTDGDYQMMVKIGELDPVAFNHKGREKDSVFYECSEPTWVYVYNGGEVNSARMTSATKAKKQKGHVRIYSVTRSSSSGETGIERINATGIDEQDRWYDLQGNRIERPMKKGIYILRGRKVVVK